MEPLYKRDAPSCIGGRKAIFSPNMILSPADHERAAWLLGPWVCPMNIQTKPCLSRVWCLFTVAWWRSWHLSPRHSVLPGKPHSDQPWYIWPLVLVYALCYPFQEWRVRDQNWCFRSVSYNHFKNNALVVSLLLKYHQSKLKITQHSCLEYIHRLLRRPWGRYRSQLHFLVGVRQLTHRALFKTCCISRPLRFFLKECYTRSLCSSVFCPPPVSYFEQKLVCYCRGCLYLGFLICSHVCGCKWIPLDVFLI